MVGGAPAIGTEHAGRVRVIHHHRRAVMLRAFDKLGKRRDVAVHAEHAVGDQQDAPVSLAACLAERTFRIVGIGVLVEDPISLGQPDAIDDARVIELVAHDAVTLLEHRADDADIHRVAALERQGRLGTLERREAALQLLVQRLRAGDGAHRTRAGAPFQRGPRRRLDQARVCVEAEIVVA